MLGEYKILYKKSSKLCKTEAEYVLKKGLNGVFSAGNRITHAPHQTNCNNFKGKADEVKSYGNFQYNNIKAHQQAQKP